MRPIQFLAATAIVAAAPALAAVMSPKTYMMKAGASDQYEIQSSQLVLETTQNQQIRDYANQMITDHNKSTADVAAAAQQAGLTPPPPMLDSMGKRNIAALQKAQGPQRDALYVQQQKKSHAMALKLQQSYASTGGVAPLKAVATNIVPVVQSHLDMVNNMPMSSM